MNAKGCALESPAMRSFEAATGTRTTMPVCSISTTIGRRTTTTMSASADPTLSRLDDCQQATEGSILVERIPQNPAKARHQKHAKPKTAAAPTGAVVERGKKILDPCCGSKMFWFDPNNQDVLFGDIRSENHVLCDGRALQISPDLEIDFRNMPFDDGSFKLVVFDPPIYVMLAKTAGLPRNMAYSVKIGEQICG